MHIQYFTDKEEFANRDRDIIPRIDDEIRFKNVVYKIKNVLWVEDEEIEHVHILIEKE